MLKKNADIEIKFRPREAHLDNLSYYPMEAQLHFQLETNGEEGMLCVEMDGVEDIELLRTTSRYISSIKISTIDPVLRSVELKMMNGTDRLRVLCNRLFYDTIGSSKK